MSEHRTEDEAAGMFDVTDFGADPDADGETNRKAIQAAVDACAARGGGVIWFPSGIYRIEGESDA